MAVVEDAESSTEWLKNLLAAQPALADSCEGRKSGTYEKSPRTEQIPVANFGKPYYMKERLTMATVQGITGQPRWRLLLAPAPLVWRVSQTKSARHGVGPRIRSIASVCPTRGVFGQSVVVARRLCSSAREFIRASKLGDQVHEEPREKVPRVRKWRGPCAGIQGGAAKGEYQNNQLPRPHRPSLVVARPLAKGD